MEIELHQFQPNFLLESPGLLPLIAAVPLIVFAMTAKNTKKERPRIIAFLLLAPVVVISLLSVQLHFLRAQDERRDSYVAEQTQLIEEKISTELGKEVQVSGETLGVWLQGSSLIQVDSNRLKAIPLALSYEQAGDQLWLPVSAVRDAPGSSTFELYIEGPSVSKSPDLDGKLLTADNFALLSPR